MPQSINPSLRNGLDRGGIGNAQVTSNTSTQAHAIKNNYAKGLKRELYTQGRSINMKNLKTDVNSLARIPSMPTY